MWAHFWHLLWRSLVYFPSELSGNWLSIVFLPIALYVIVEGIRYGWRSMVKKAFGRDAGILVGMYVLLFCWAVIHTVYQDHINLARQNAILRRQLEFRETHGVSLKLQSAVARWSDVGLQIQANLLASNDGKPTT